MVSAPPVAMVHRFFAVFVTTSAPSRVPVAAHAFDVPLVLANEVRTGRPHSHHQLDFIASRRGDVGAHLHVMRVRCGKAQCVSNRIDWALGSGLWALGSGLWALGSGLWAFDSRDRKST